MITIEKSEILQAIKQMPNRDRLEIIPSTADAFQVRSVPQQRLIKQVGIIDRYTMQQISQSLGIVLNIN